MPTVKDFFDRINEFAPFSTIEKWDNCGLQVGSPTLTVTGCVVALDVTNEVIALAQEQGANLIVTHHPVIFRPLSAIRGDDRLNRLITAGIASISAHTNLDRAVDGVNDALFRALGLSEPEPFPNAYSLGWMGVLPQPMTVPELAVYVRGKLHAGAVQYAGMSPESLQIIRKVAVASGASGDDVIAAKDAGVDALITGEAKHSDWIDAVNLEFPMLAAGHHDTEKVVLEPLQRKLASFFPKVPFWTYQEMRLYTLSGIS